VDLKRLTRRFWPTPALPPQHRAHLAAAARIQRHRPGWLITWGSQTRRYWAFPEPGTHPHQLLSATTARELTTLIDNAERRWRTPPPPHKPTGRGGGQEC
jgi:hypothetical protein